MAGDRLGIEVGCADGVLRELAACDRSVAQLLCADAARGKAQRGVGRAPERYEQSEQGDGVVADEGEGLKHWTGVSLLGARGASARAEARSEERRVGEECRYR